MASESGGSRRVVILGGGFGGLAAAKALKRAAVQVTVVDRTNHHLFQPLLYQVAVGALSEGQAATPIRVMLKRQRNAEVLMAEAVDVDVGAREVALDSGERLGYDSLIVACGGETSYFGHDEWRDTSCGLKTMADALELRRRIYGALEQAERATDAAAREEWMTFAIVGGGPTGVEVGGQLAVLARHQLRHTFSRIDTAEARVILVDAGERVLPAFSEKLSATAAKEIGSLGVEVREGLQATAIDERGLTVKAGETEERIAARTVVWAAGVRAALIGEVIARATGARTDRAGRVEVEPNCTIAGHPEISVIGDIAIHQGPDGKPLPGLATVAIQQAHHVAKAIAHGEPGASSEFRYFDKGALAVVGRGRAVCEVRGREVSGPLAFFTYLGVHFFYLSGVIGNRLGVLGTWIRAGFGGLENQVIEGGLASVEPAQASAPPKASAGG